MEKQNHAETKELNKVAAQDEKKIGMKESSKEGETNNSGGMA